MCCTVTKLMIRFPSLIESCTYITHGTVFDIASMLYFLYLLYNTPHADMFRSDSGVEMLIVTAIDPEAACQNNLHISILVICQNLLFLRNHLWWKDEPDGEGTQRYKLWLHSAGCSSLAMLEASGTSTEATRRSCSWVHCHPCLN